MVQRQQCVIYVQNLAQKEYVVGNSGINENACRVCSQGKNCCLTSVISFSWIIPVFQDAKCQLVGKVVSVAISQSRLVFQKHRFFFARERSKQSENWNTYHIRLAHSQSHSKHSKGKETYEHALHSSNIKYMWGMATPSSVKRTFTRPSHPTHNSTNNDTYIKKIVKNSPEFRNTFALVKHLAFEVASYFGQKMSLEWRHESNKEGCSQGGDPFSR